MEFFKDTLLMFLIMLMPQSCCNARRIAQVRADSVIQFGRTGGFTNIPDEYLLTKKGKVFKISDNIITCINDIPGRQLNSIIRKLDDIGFDNIDLNEPGNISYFIKVTTSKYENRVIWNDLTTNDSIKNLYKELITTIRP